MSGFNVSSWALRHRSLVLYFMVLVAILGGFSYTRLGQSEDPPFMFKVMVITTDWPGASAAQVQGQITDRIERKLQEAPGVDFVRSFSRPGRSVVFFGIQDSMPASRVPDLYYQVRKRVGDMVRDLPVGVRGPWFDDEFGDVYVNLYALSGDGFTQAQLHDYGEQIRAELLHVHDVGKVDFFGDAQPTLYVELDSVRLARLGVNLAQVVQALGQDNAIAPSGTIQTSHDRVVIRPGPGWKGKADIAATHLSVQGHDFTLGDVAHITRGYEDPRDDHVRFAGHDVLAFGVSMSAGGDVIRLGDALRNTLDSLGPRLPAGLKVQLITSMPRAVRHSINDFLESVAEAVAIVLAVSLLSLGLRTGLIVVISIPLVLTATALGMHLADIGLHKISLGTLVLALGLLVDDAIIAVEMMAVKLEQGWDRMRAAAYAYTSTAFPMLTGTLVTVAGFLPIVLARSSTGEYTRSIFQVSALALLTSWVAAVVVIPLLGYYLLPERRGTLTDHDRAHHEAAVYGKPFHQRLRRLIEQCIRHKALVLLGTGLAFVVAVMGFGLLQQQFFPSSARPELLVDLKLGEGASMEAIEAQVKRFETILASFPQVENEVAFVGAGAPRFYLPLDQQLAAPNIAQFLITARSVPDRDALEKSLEPILATQFGNLRTRVSRLENGPPVGFPVQFRVSGSDLTQVRHLADQVADRLRANPHARNIQLDWEEMGLRTLRVDLDDAALRRLGLARTDVENFLQTAVSGTTATQYRDKDRSLNVVVRAGRAQRTDPAALGALAIPLGGGRSVPLAQLARITPDIETAVIWTRDRQPTITVQSDAERGFQGMDITGEVDPRLADIRASLPLGYRIEIGGAVESSIKAQKSINDQMPIMLLVVITLLMIQLQSVSRVIMIVLTAPLGLIGVAPALLIFHQPFGFVAMLGTIAMLGIIMRNSVILIDQIDRDIHGGLAPFHAIIEATVRRFRPITLTAATAVLALIPLLRNDFFGPMATALMGGITVATVLTLFVLPALYALWFRVHAPQPASPATLPSKVTP